MIGRLVLVLGLALAGCTHVPALSPDAATAAFQAALDDRPLCVLLPDTMSAERNSEFLPPIARSEAEREAFAPFIAAGLVEEVPGSAGPRQVPVWRYRPLGAVGKALSTCWVPTGGYPEETISSGFIYARRKAVDAVVTGRSYRTRCGTWEANAGVEVRLEDVAPWYDEARLGPLTNRTPANAAGTKAVSFDFNGETWQFTWPKAHMPLCSRQP